MADVLVDTDVFIDHLRGARRLDPGEDRLHFSTVTRAELFAGPAAQREIVAALLEPFAEIPVTRPIAELAGGIRHETGTALPDALIAATALSGPHRIHTRNRRDFEAVAGLVFHEPG